MGATFPITPLMGATMGAMGGTYPHLSLDLALNEQELGAARALGALRRGFPVCVITMFSAQTPAGTPALQNDIGVSMRAAERIVRMCA